MAKTFWLDQRFQLNLPLWTVVVPFLAMAMLSVQLLWHLDFFVIHGLVAILLIGAVFASVHHAEVIAHKIGEPYGTLVLAIAVTVIEVALIVALMSSSAPEDRAILARDTVYSAVMLVCNGIVGLCLLIGGLRNHVQGFTLKGVNKAVSVLLTLALIVFILPNFTESMKGGQMLVSQAIFIGTSSFILYGAFIFSQTVRHREYFMVTEGDDHHHATDNLPTVLTSSILLLLGLVAVVGLAKMLSPLIEKTVFDLGLPKVMIGIIIASLVLLPESVAAIKAAYQNKLQVSLNLALGSALACIGLTIPTIVAITAWTGDILVLGLSNKASLMLVITLLVTMNTLSTGKTTFLQGMVHLVLLATFIFFSIVP